MAASFAANRRAGQEDHQIFRRQVFLLLKMSEAPPFGKIRAPEEIECHPLIPPASPRLTR
jgi:hypothetical protein